MIHTHAHEHAHTQSMHTHTHNTSTTRCRISKGTEIAFNCTAHFLRSCAYVVRHVCMNTSLTIHLSIILIYRTHFNTAKFVSVLSVTLLSVVILLLVLLFLLLVILLTSVLVVVCVVFWGAMNRQRSGRKEKRGPVFCICVCARVWCVCVHDWFVRERENERHHTSYIIYHTSFIHHIHTSN